MPVLVVFVFLYALCMKTGCHTNKPSIVETQASQPAAPPPVPQSNTAGVQRCLSSSLKSPLVYCPKGQILAQTKATFAGLQT